MPLPFTAKAAKAPAETDFQQALAAHGRGQLAQAEALCKKILKRQPRHFDALHLSGVVAYQCGRHAEATQLIGKAIAAAPANALFHSNRGNAFRALGNVTAAIEDYDRAIALRPDLAEVHYNRANALHDLERFEEALTAYERAIALNPAMVDAHQGLGSALAKLQRWEAALASLTLAIALQPATAELHFVYGTLLAKSKQPTAALAAYDKAVTLKADFPAAYYNRANTLFDLKQFDAALASYDRALALWPKVAEVHHARGTALARLGRSEAALAAYDQAIALKPEFSNPHLARGDMLLQMKRRDEALESYSKALTFVPPHRDARKKLVGHIFQESEDHEMILALSDQASRLNISQEISEFGVRPSLPAARVRHDLEQISYLLAQAGNDRETDLVLAEAQRALQAALGRHPEAEPLARIALSAAEIASISRFLEMRPRHPIAAADGLNPANDWAAIETAYFASTPEIVVIDNFLAPAALLALRQFCLASAVWKADYENGYLGAFVEDGFVTPLHLKIAQDLRARMPRIFGGEVLEQMWGFKYGPGKALGINIHADFAKVNLNFWITPDEANLDPTSGGMVIYDVPSPRSWSFADYNNNSQRIFDFLNEHNAGRQKVAYRCNRAVLFNSSLFHETDEIHFKDGYENRRINVTYLFGHQLS